MACGACQKARAQGLTGQGIWAAKSTRVISSGEAELIRYDGNKEGSIAYRGPSKTVYYFGKGDTKFVLKEDVPMFLQYSEFSVVQQQEEAVAPLGQPILMASGQA